MGIFVRKATKQNFAVFIEKWNPRHIETISPSDYHTFGLTPNMSLTEAKEEAQKYNKKAKFEKKKEVNSFLRAKTNKSINEIYLPTKLISEFETFMGKMYEDNEERLHTILQHWRSSQKLIVEINCLPVDFFNKRFEIYSYYKKLAWSPDYMKRITKILNQWGSFYARKKLVFYEPVPRIEGSWKQKVLNAREEKTDVRRPAEPLTVTLLKKHKNDFENSNLQFHWNWLYIGLYLGLRPSEIDSLLTAQNWKSEYDEVNEIDVLYVYQSKLQMLSKDKRWKIIPLHSKDQKKALSLIELKQFQRPLVKTIKRIIGDGFDCYSPRKGFTDLMLEEGWQLEDISVFLGHSSIETTWKHYKNKKRFKLPKAVA